MDKLSIYNCSLINLDGRTLSNSDKFSDCLVRLPLFYELEEEVIEKIGTYFSDTKKRYYEN
jgi:dTDP-4-amino-4,6-dideoxygalactose transaminase